jgi:hypothetical protein
MKWKKIALQNDLFLKLMVSISVGFVVAAYNNVSESLDEKTRIDGEMKEFKNLTLRELADLKIKYEKFHTEQTIRTDNVDFSGLLKNGDERAIKHLCLHIKKDCK